MNNRKGFFLVFSLGVLIVLSLFCLGLGFRTYIQTRKTKLFLNKQRAFYLAVSGVKIAAQVLAEDKISECCYLGQDWVKPIEKEIAFSFPAKLGRLSVNIEDESARININRVGNVFVKAVKKLMVNKGVDNPDEKLNCIADYIGADSSPPDADSEDEDRVKNAPLSVLTELLMIGGISLDDYDKIKGFISIAPMEKVNINTASREVVDSLIADSFGGKSEIMDKLFGCPQRGYYSAQEWVLAKNGEIDAEFNVSLKNIFCVSSQYYRVVSEAEVEGVKKKITCIVNRDSGKILYWYES